ncbi:YraN family protein [bacterium]|jgi:putative endonuclease|nr:YraN family protein [bacterium]MDP6571379.1 YraN family protein [Patescibacteria group bacterium]MDP6756489.1 YraN family protein [Patescibacteria group bacterium]|tara:strand:+ start:13298 stop:13663 length:366 start_codon:yes stop_codon:yes gene_type:complete
MLSPTQNIGSWGEKVAAWYLKKQGCLIIKTHFTNRFGEIDIIAKQNDEFVFVEVKTRSKLKHGLPEQAVDYRKQKRLKKVISAYLSLNQIEKFRIDIISISPNTSSKKLTIRHHKAVLNIF